ncbi:hypothetical protein OROGR_015371 [Orobanche gracilis]
MASLPKSATSEKLKSQFYVEVDPEECNSELLPIYDHYKSCLDLFQQQAALNYTPLTGISASKDLGDRTIFLAHVTPFYPKPLARFPAELLNFLESSARILPGVLRLQLVQALAFLINWKMIGLAEALHVFMELQTLGDRVIQKMAFSHVIQSITLMNQEHRNNPKNEAVQNSLFEMLQKEDEAKAMRVLITLCELHREKVWSDERTVDAICTSCFHPSSRIVIAALSFLLDDGGDDSNSEDGQATLQPQVVLNIKSIHNASHKGTTSSKKKKKKAKLQQQRLSSEKSDRDYSSPLNHLKDAQGFSEKLFSHLQSSSNDIFEVKIMILKVIARTVGLHHLILLDFYPYLQKYVEPHKQDVTALLAAAVEACHETVPSDAVKPLFKQIVNQFVHDGSRPEDITVGLNVVREMCLRMPLLMTKELLQNLVFNRKSHEKAVSASARSLLALFREICPSLLVKKDRGRPAELRVKPKAFSEVHVPSNVPGVELLEEEDDEMGEDNEVYDDDVNYIVDGASGIGDKKKCESCDEHNNSIGKDADVDSNTSKEKKRKLSDLDAANLSLAALKNLLNEALMPYKRARRGIATMEPPNNFRRSPLVDRRGFLRRRIVSQRLSKEASLAVKRALRDTTRKLSCCELARIANAADDKAKLATTHQEKKRKDSCNQFRGRKL